MGIFRYTSEVFALPERVWAALVDVEHWPEWTPTVTRVQRMEDGALTLGSRTKIWQPKLIPAVWRVIALDEIAGVFTWVTSRPGIQITATHRIEPSPARDGTSVTLVLDYAGLLGPLMAWRFKDLNWDYLTKEAAGLKQLCER
jgi:polyketide cyclase/dehydrase/lipid transport protein